MTTKNLKALQYLVNKLIECVLAIGSRLAPDYRPGAVVDLITRPYHVLPVTLHVPLLEIGREPVHDIMMISIESY